MLGRLIDWLEGADTHTFTVAAPLCSPVRRVLTALAPAGLNTTRGRYGIRVLRYKDGPAQATRADGKPITVGQIAEITVSATQARWAEYVLEHLRTADSEGFQIVSSPADIRNRIYAERRGGEMPTPWKASGCR